MRWSAAAKPATGADSIRIGVVKRDVRFRFAFEAQQPATRAAAEAQLLALLEDRAKRRERTLLALDFPLGLPRGLAARLKLAGEPPWRAVWDQLGRMVKDKPDNQNNRFGVGSEINRRLTGGPFPFWGCPPKDALTTLASRRGREHGLGDLPEFRHVEAALGAAAPVWKLYYNQATGPQAILGIPMLRRLKLTLGERMRVWPFETGFVALTEQNLEGVEVILAEIAASGHANAPQAGETREAAQVRSLAERLARADEQGALGSRFAPPHGTEPEVVRVAEAEEGWALSV